MKKIRIKNWVIEPDHEHDGVIHGFAYNEKKLVSAHWSLYPDKDVFYKTSNLRPLPKYVKERIKKITIDDLGG